MAILRENYTGGGNSKKMKSKRDEGLQARKETYHEDQFKNYKRLERNMGGPWNKKVTKVFKANAIHRAGCRLGIFTLHSFTFSTCYRQYRLHVCKEMQENADC
ncbi:hypothetical protein FGSG_12735 [Fusarium graminearum PH-1]|nr:hypothetical protein FGSG_12735 [Fusarium graminearum PH-1]ESU11375.1 hypothetical protein FGSG_12735 [Fusarium graminearum PH-1]|eukprot:XP_011323951.1 hypothetical protein FGSG_12735 [Fusarium graminearum PH-1]